MSHSDTILFINSSPGPDAESHADWEFREIKSAYQRSLDRSKFEMESFWSVRPRDLRRGLIETEPLVLHISGNSAGKGVILEDNQGNPKSVTAKALSGLFGLFQDKMKWVILSGCYDEDQAGIISEVIPNVIGLDASLSPDARIEAACAIYDSLMDGQKRSGIDVAKLALSLCRV